MVMRSMYGPEKLLMASKKPRLINLVSNVANMSDEEIQGLNEKPDVIKGLLAIKKSHMQEEAAKRAEIIANQMIAASLRNM